MLRVPPFRGDTVAAGVVVLATLVVLLELRMGWPAGVQLSVVAAAGAGIGILLGGCPRESRPYVSAIVVSLLVLSGFALVRLAQVLGADRVGAGTLVWTLVLFGALAVRLATRYDAAAATLGAGLAACFWPAAFASWVANPGAGVVRLLLLLAVVALALGTVSLRDRHPDHAAQLANAAGAGLLGIAATVVFVRAATVLLAATGGSGFGAAGLGWGWELCVLAGGAGLVAYGAVDRQRGPVLVGIAALSSYVIAAAEGKSSLLGWPIPLAITAVVLLSVGLRPTSPAPEEPRTDLPPTPPVDLRGSPHDT